MYICVTMPKWKSISYTEIKETCLYYVLNFLYYESKTNTIHNLLEPQNQEAVYPAGHTSTLVLPNGRGRKKV